MRKTNIILTTAGLVSSLAFASAAQAGVTFKDGDKYMKLGGRIQLQYHQADDGSTATDTVFFRRFRPYIEGSVSKNWKGKFQWDMGKAEDTNELAVKDAYMQYKGVKNLKVTIGNANFPFSREFLTSSKKQQLVERTFVGDHNYGTPDRNTGIFLSGHSDSKLVTWGAAATSASIDPDVKKLDFDTPVNANDDFNEGWMVGGRVDFHPFGQLKFSQGDFSGKTRATIGLAAFSWSNDGDNNTYTVAGASTSASKADIDSVTGLEISGALRTSGLSVDAQYNRFTADTVDTGFTGGMFRNGSTELTNWSVEGGFMIVPKTLEVVAGYQSQDADGYAVAWNRTSMGANWFINKHKVKVQFSYRMGENLKGVKGDDEDEIFVQTQYVF